MADAAAPKKRGRPPKAAKPEGEKVEVSLDCYYSMSLRCLFCYLVQTEGTHQKSRKASGRSGQ